MIRIIYTQLFLLLLLYFAQWNTSVASSTERRSYLPISINVSGKLALCSHAEKGSIVLSVSGGVAPYTFLWNTRETTKDRSDLYAGTYTVEITDAVGSIHVERIVVQPPYPLILEPLVKSDASCGSGQDGFAKLAVKVGRGEPYKISWSNGLKDVWEASNLAPGVYSVSIVDKYNCDVTTTFEIKAATQGINVSETIQDISCSGTDSGAINLNVTGGSGDFTYQWSNGSNTKDISNLTPGEYSVFVKDQKGCSYQATYQVGEEAPIILESETVNESCVGASNGSISVEVSGGKAPYTYLWNNGQSGASASALTSGKYALQVTDATGCSVNREFSIAATSNISVHLKEVKNPSCTDENGGTIDLEVKDASGSYSVIWSDGVEGLRREGLAEGIYEVLVKDESGCEVSKSFNVSKPAELNARIETTLDVDCEQGLMNGIAWVTIQGGKQPYHISWDSGEKDQREINFYKSGNLQVKVTDSFGCTTVSEVKVVIPSQNPASNRLDFNFRKLEINNNDEVKVKEEVLFESTISEDFIAWEWAFGDGNSSSDKDPIHVFDYPGDYEVTLTAFDAYGCSSVERNRIQVIKASDIITIPNAFTPNGDGLNDVFTPKFTTPTSFTMEIFNNWGERVYSSSGSESEGWDGTYRGQGSPAGNFLYQINFTSPDGEVILRTGGFTLVR